MGQMVTYTPAIYDAPGSWMEEPVRVLENAPAEFATMLGSVIEEVKDAIKVPLGERKVLLAAAIVTRAASTADGQEELFSLLGSLGQHSRHTECY